LAAGAFFFAEVTGAGVAFFGDGFFAGGGVLSGGEVFFLPETNSFARLVN
jgi:hypothetical protein